MDYDKLEMRLRKTIEKRLAQGFNLLPGMHYVVKDECFCAVGSICVEVGGRQFLDRGVIDLWACDANVLESISDGFEGIGDRLFTMYGTRDHRAYAIGQSLRRDYCEFNS